MTFAVRLFLAMVAISGISIGIRVAMIGKCNPFFGCPPEVEFMAIEPIRVIYNETVEIPISEHIKTDRLHDNSFIKIEEPYTERVVRFSISGAITQGVEDGRGHNWIYGAKFRHEP